MTNYKVNYLPPIKIKSFDKVYEVTFCFYSLTNSNFTCNTFLITNSYFKNLNFNGNIFENCKKNNL